MLCVLSYTTKKKKTEGGREGGREGGKERKIRKTTSRVHHAHVRPLVSASVRVIRHTHTHAYTHTRIHTNDTSHARDTRLSIGDRAKVIIIDVTKEKKDKG